MHMSLKVYGENELNDRLKKNGGMLGKMDRLNLGIQQTHTCNPSTEYMETGRFKQLNKKCEKTGVGEGVGGREIDD